MAYFYSAAMVYFASALYTRRSTHPLRDEVIVSLLLDTGIRASELCGLRMRDLSSDLRSIKVCGKGNKSRVCYLGKVTSKLMRVYLNSQHKVAGDPVFANDKGQALTISGHLQLMYRLSEAAGIYPLVSVHQMRRTFAVSILRNGANLPSVQRMMGHTNITMTQRYLLLAQADIEAQHSAFSPRDNL